jgi:hypothetical protein
MKNNRIYQKKIIHDSGWGYYVDPEYIDSYNHTQLTNIYHYHKKYTEVEDDPYDEWCDFNLYQEYKMDDHSNDIENNYCLYEVEKTELNCKCNAICLISNIHKNIQIIQILTTIFISASITYYCLYII